MRIDAITLFPEMFGLVRDMGVTGRAHKQGIWSLQTWNPREFTLDTHRTVDDRPYGGGPGMVMMAEPLAQAVTAIHAERTRLDLPRSTVVMLSPTGKQFTQATAGRLSESAGVIFVCGRYEGIDQRFIDQHVDAQWSLGDFVLSGGEVAAIAMIDAAVRLLPGTLNHGASAVEDSFQDALSGMLDSPHYTRPEILNGTAVPAVLMSGNHALIQRWRREQSLLMTANNRPDLILLARTKGLLTKADEQFLARLA